MRQLRVSDPNVSMLKSDASMLKVEEMEELVVHSKPYA
jgi:hypothetical protein